MKKGVALIILCSLTWLLCTSQTHEDHKFYSKELVFEEDFNDNENNWTIYYTDIKRGKYLVETIAKDGPALSTLPVKLDTTKDYEIETTISMEWNRTAEFMGIAWNINMNNGYYFGFNKENKFVVYRKNYDEIETLKEASSKRELIPLYERVIITIRKINHEYVIILNNRPLFKLPANKFYGHDIGYFVGKASELRAYNLKVSYLK
jgi:hypothetical protein